MLQIAMFGVGLLLILIGVHMMSQRGEGDDGGDLPGATTVC